MCGRYALYGPTSRIREQFDVDDGFDVGPRYNIAPTTKVLIVQSGPGGERVAKLHRWGLIPSWAKDASIGAKLINARGETVAEKPAFHAAFRRWRCIVPGNGFYEWKAVQEAGRTIKQPYFIRPQAEGELFGFAGLTERWVSPEGRRGSHVLHHHDGGQRADDADSRPDARDSGTQRLQHMARPNQH